jgi:hypothetical protein
MRKLLVVLMVVIVLSGVAFQTGLARPLVKWQVESALLESGMAQERADCMASRMVDRLTVWQLWQLRQGMAPRKGEPAEGYGLGELIKRLRRVEDTEAVLVVTTSAGLCAVGIG